MFFIIIIIFILFRFRRTRCAGGPGWVAARGRTRSGRGNRLGRTREIATARSASGDVRDAVRALARAQQIARDIPFTERTVGQARAAAATRDPCRATGSVFSRGGEGFPCARSELVFLSRLAARLDRVRSVHYTHTAAAVHIIIIIVVFRERTLVCAAFDARQKKL